MAHENAETPEGVPARSRDLELLRELVHADEALAAALAELDELARQTTAVRERADELRALLARAPSERVRIADALASAEREARDCAVALAEAERELTTAESKRDEARLAAARRFLVRAKDAAAMAGKRVAALQAEGVQLELHVGEAEREASQVEARAAEIADALHDRPRLAMDAGRSPRPGLAGVSEWSSGARAALVVAQSSVRVEREALIRQANELGSALLGEPLVATSAAAVARRVEEASSANQGRGPARH